MSALKKRESTEGWPSNLRQCHFQAMTAISKREMYLGAQRLQKEHCMKKRS